MKTFLTASLFVMFLMLPGSNAALQYIIVFIMLCLLYEPTESEDLEDDNDT